MWTVRLLLPARPLTAAVGADFRPSEPAPRCCGDLSELIEANRDELVLMEVANLGMPIHIAQSFVIDNAVASLRYYAGWATKIEGRTVKLGIPDMRGDGAIGPAFHAYSNKEPVGVVGAIVPWNVPLLIGIGQDRAGHHGGLYASC